MTLPQPLERDIGDVQARERLPVTLVGAIRPIKGISSYTEHLLQALAARDDLAIHFLGFRSLYPSLLYPGGSPSDSSSEPPKLPDVAVHNALSWYNPLGWIVNAWRLGRRPVVHAQWWSYVLAPAYIALLGVARLRGTHVVVTVHNVEPHEGGVLRRTLNRSVFLLAHALVVHTEGNRSALLDSGWPSAKVHVVEPAVLTARRSGLTREQARELLGVASETPVLLFFGSIRPYKGLDVLLRAMQLVKERQPGVRLVVAGQPWSGWNQYAELISKLGLDGTVLTDLRYVPDNEVERYFLAADVVVAPYLKFDGQSAVAFLNLSFAVPMVVTEVGGLPDVVNDGRAVVPPGDHSALAEAIAALLDSPELRAELSSSLQETARRHSGEEWAARTADVYHAVCRRGREAGPGL